LHSCSTKYCGAMRGPGAAGAVIDGVTRYRRRTCAGFAMRPAILAPRTRYTTANGAQPSLNALFVYFGPTVRRTRRRLG
jgi:hypothetical protein